MMKLAFVLAALVVVASAQVVQQQVRQHIPILRHEHQIHPDGRWQYLYETGNGIRAQAVGEHKPAVREGPIHSVNGQFSWTSDDGTPVQISYIADENGYQPRGAAIPTPPPIPEAILKSLDVIARSNPQQ